PTASTLWDTHSGPPSPSASRLVLTCFGRSRKAGTQKRGQLFRELFHRLFCLLEGGLAGKISVQRSSSRAHSRRRRRSRNRRSADWQAARCRNVRHFFFGRKAGTRERTRSAARNQLQAARLRTNFERHDSRRRSGRGV